MKDTFLVIRRYLFILYLFKNMNKLLHLKAPFATGGQKFFFLFGAPGVGKGTYAKLLRKDLQFNHVSTGDEIRKILKGTVSSDFDSKLI